MCVCVRAGARQFVAPPPPPLLLRSNIYIHTDSRMRARSSVEVQVNKDISAHGRCYVHMCECVEEYARALGLDLEHPPSAQPPRILVTRVSSILFGQVPIVHIYIYIFGSFLFYYPIFCSLLTARVGFCVFIISLG